MKTFLKNLLDIIQESINFSGSILVKKENETITELNYGYANRSERLLSEEHTNRLLTPHVHTGDFNEFYGYRIWIDKNDDGIFKYHVMGYDPGVSFHSAYYPKQLINTVICSNKSSGAYERMKKIEQEIRCL